MIRLVLSALVKNTVKLHIGESIVTLTFTGKSTENTRTKLVNLLSEAYTERVKKWQ